jgi:2-polyprenyl-3-methyl-5-hydroxy-6-metoxy-1,4-benzoquinol methylase
MKNTEEFWDTTWSDTQPFHLEPAAFAESLGSSERAFLAQVGPVTGKSLLDLGCGNGELSVYFAKLGADVTAVDNSAKGVENAERLASFNGVQIRALKLDAAEIGQLGDRFEIVVGRFILHHLEPFDEFSRILQQVLAPHGRALFLENSARNRLLMFFRDHLTGRFGVPKYGDAEEHPLKPEEIRILEGSFASVAITYPEFLFFRLVGAYIFKGKPGWMRFFERADRLAHRVCPALCKYGYLQIIEIRN